MKLVLFFGIFLLNANAFAQNIKPKDLIGKWSFVDTTKGFSFYFKDSVHVEMENYGIVTSGDYSLIPHDSTSILHINNFKTVNVKYPKGTEPNMDPEESINALIKLKNPNTFLMQGLDEKQ